MAKNIENFKNICNDKENKLLNFEKNFLNKYIKSDLNFGKLFEKKIVNYFQKIIKKEKRKIIFNFSNKDSDKMILQSARIDFSACLLEYLEDKYIVLKDSTDLKIIESKILTLDELKKNQLDMFLELNNIMELIDDLETKKIILLYTGTNENIANYIFSRRLFLDLDIKIQFNKVKILIDTNKEGISKINYKCLDSNEKDIFSTELIKKNFGAQFGGIISIQSNNEKKRLFFKTHQEGSRFTNFSGILYYSKSISFANPVNLRELFIYKVLEKLDLGPETKFVVNPFVFQDLYIVTKDLNDINSNKIFMTAVNINKKEIEKLINDKDVILEFTKFDLISRILGIYDLNEGNYGILYEGDKKFVKIIDFRTAYTDASLSEISLTAFLKANGNMYKSKSLAKKILSNREVNQKLKEGLETLKSIGYEKFIEVVNSVKIEIINFISQKDEISNFEIKKQIGLEDEVIEDLNMYIKIIKENFNLSMNYFKKNHQ